MSKEKPEASGKPKVQCTTKDRFHDLHGITKQQAFATEDIGSGQSAASSNRRADMVASSQGARTQVAQDREVSDQTFAHDLPLMRGERDPHHDDRNAADDVDKRRSDSDADYGEASPCGNNMKCSCLPHRPWAQHILRLTDSTSECLDPIEVKAQAGKRASFHLQQTSNSWLGPRTHARCKM